MTSKHNIKIDVKQEDIGKRFKTSSSSSPPTGTATNTTVKTENVSPNANNINEGTTNITLHPKQQLAIDLATIVKTENLSPNANNSNEGTTNITLHPKQQLAIDLAAQGKSIFVTGQGGTGKSLVLREIIKGFKQQRYRSDEWAALAPTGIAAIALESGRTVHSFAGCGIPELVEDFGKCWGNKKEWRKLKVLVIDEISMLSGEFLDNLNKVVSAMRGKKSAFGGIQLIFCGDFLQLPPISKKIQDIKAIISVGKYTKEQLHCDQGFAFQSNLWKDADLEVIQLHHIFRQDNAVFQEVLSEIRYGKVSHRSEVFLNRCNRPLPVLNDIKPTILYPRNKDVTAENQKELSKLKEPVRDYYADDNVYVDTEIEEDSDKYWAALDALSLCTYFSDCIAQKRLQLKKGAQVMLIKNESSYRLVNGSRGVVIGFTIDCNEDGSVYDLIEDVDKCSNNDILHPVVKFLSGTTKAIQPEAFTYIMAGLGFCVRTAVPLKLAWAITIHKSQGMSIDYVKADLSGVFSFAQTYVALSRVTDESGLYLLGFKKDKVKADIRALQFYENPIALFPHWSNAWVKGEEAMDNSEKKVDVQVPHAKPDSLQGLVFVFTGEPVYLSRTQIEDLVKACGGFVRGAVSGKTHFLVIGDQMEDGRDVVTGNKYKKAKSIGSTNKSELKIINEVQLYDLVKKGKQKEIKTMQSFFKAAVSPRGSQPMDVQDV